MDCKLVNKHLSSLLGNSISELDEYQSFEIDQHISECPSCNQKWQPDKRLLQKLKSYYSSVRASENLKVKIFKSVENEGNLSSFKIKQIAVAASFMVLVTMTFYVDKACFNLPQAYEVHKISEYHLSSTNIEELLQHIGIPLNKGHFTNFTEAAFIPSGALKIHKPFNKTLGTIALKNTNGQKLTVCFYPGSYMLAHTGITNVDGTDIYHGNSNSHNFAYWNTNGMTVVLISDSLLSQEMIDLAMPIILEKGVS